MFRTLSDVIDRLSAHGDKPAVVVPGRRTVETWTYGDLADRAGALAQGLAQAGLRKGDAVTLLSGNSAEWIAACLAVIRAGGVIVPLDVQLEDGTLDRVLEDSGARFAFVTASGAGRLRRDDADARPRPVVLDDADDERSWRRLTAGAGRPLPPVEPGDLAALFYTSGTTGPPKGVPLSHANLVFQLNAIVAAELATPDDRVLLPLPLHHVYPFVFGMLAPLALGLPIVLPRSLTGPEIASAMRDRSVTLIMGVPRLYSAFDTAVRTRIEAYGRIAAGLVRAGLAASMWLGRHLGLRPGLALFRPLRARIAPDLRLLVSGGAALDPDLARRLEGFGWQVASGYGLTETSPMLTWNLPGEGRLETAGRPVPGVELRIASGGKEPPAAEDDGGAHGYGEILVRGPGVFAGYRNLPDKTGKAFTEDGWFRTGDLGYLDDGYLCIVGRASTMIVTESGKNVQPETVEDAYLASPVIREIGVLQKDGRLVAVIVPNPNAIGPDGDPAKAVDAALREQSRRLPSYQRLADYAITPEPLPRTRLGKPRRHLLAERFDRAKQGDIGIEAAQPVAPEAMSAEDRALLGNPAARSTWDWLAGRYADRRLTPDSSPQLDLGVDSMEWITFTLEIGQRTGVELSEETIARIETVRDLLREVAEASGSGETAFSLSILDRPEAHLTDDQKRWLKPLGPAEARFARVLHGIDRLIMRHLFRLQAHGVDRLPEGQAVFTPTHGSFLDPFVVAAALDYGRLRRTFWAGDAGVAFGNALTRRVSRLAQAVPIDPRHGAFSSLALGAAVLKRGESLVWFPEGQRSHSGEVQDFKPGIGILLERYPVPVIPVAIHGAYQAYPPGRLLPRLGRITVAFGDPLAPSRLEREGTGEEASARITDALRRHVTELQHRTQPTPGAGTGISRPGAESRPATAEDRSSRPR
jgi:long-chain acyl-CoA synthetase